MKRNMKKLLVMALSVLLISATVTQAAAAGADTRRIGISQTNVSIGVGETVQIKVTGTKKKVKWSTSNRKVATVKGGKITGRKKGRAVITAKVKGKTLKCRVTVKKKPYLSRKSASIYAGEAAILKVYGTSKKARWYSSNEKVAAVNAGGKVSGKGAGTAIIAATVDGVTLTCKVKVKRVLVVSKKKLNIRGSGTVKVTLHKYAAVNCYIADSSVATSKWGTWRTLKNGSYEVTLTITGKQKGSTKMILTNSYNKEAPEVTLNVLKAKS